MARHLQSPEDARDCLSSQRTTPAMQQLGYDILTYLAEHPDAQDTTEGIIEWWLSERAVKPNVALVEEALTELVDLGFILTRRSEEARAYYKVNRRKLKEISAMLTQRGGAPEN
jgi:DNA-binding PadR family transcriptional regulator